jgi:hypothetical protein
MMQSKLVPSPLAKSHSTVGLLLALAAACSQKSPERPPYAELSCEGTKCKPQTGLPIVGVPPGAGSGAPDDASSDIATSTGDGASDDSTSSSGSSNDVVILEPQEATDLQRTAGAPIGRPYALYSWPDVDVPLWKSAGVNAETVPVEAHGQWLLVLVTDNAEALDPDWLPTLTWQHPSTYSVTVPVFRTQFWTDLAAGLAVSPTTLDPTAGHVLIQVVNTSGQPQLGVSAEVVAGVVAYGNGGTASDVLTETDDSGLLVWLNAPTGDATTLTLKTDSNSQTIDVPTRASSVTVAAMAL